jgi:hypothetical protein
VLLLPQQCHGMATMACCAFCTCTLCKGTHAACGSGAGQSHCACLWGAQHVDSSACGQLSMWDAPAQAYQCQYLAGCRAADGGEVFELQHSLQHCT